MEYLSCDMRGHSRINSYTTFTRADLPRLHTAVRKSSPTNETKWGEMSHATTLPVAEISP